MFCLKVWAWIKVRGWKHRFVQLRAFPRLKDYASLGRQRYLSLSPGEAARLAKFCWTQLSVLPARERWFFLFFCLLVCFCFIYLFSQGPRTKA